MVKSVFEVDVDDQSFKDFSTLFDKYQKQLQKMPGAWAGINKEMKSSFEAATAALMAQSQLNRQSQQAQKDQLKRTKDQASYWHSMASSSSEFVRNLYRATGSLIRWTGLAAEIGGLLGIGGLWGLDRLAGSVGSGRRVSQGLGLANGERMAFGLNYGRITDPSQFLGGVNEALHDPSQRYRLYAAGMGAGDLAGKDTAGVATMLMDRYKQLADRTDPQMLAAQLKAHGGLMSLEDFERLKALSPEEYGSIRSSYSKDARGLGLPDKMQRTWQEFDIQLHRAGQTIENAFVRGLTPLIPQLDRLSKIAAGLVTNFMTWLDKSHAIEKVGTGIQKLGDYLTSDSFAANMKMFGDDLLFLAGKIHSAAVLFGAPDNSAAAKANPNRAPGASILQKFKGSLEDNSPEVFGPWAGMLGAIAKAESNNGDPKYMHSYGKNGQLLASGKYGLSPGVAKFYGVDPMNEVQAKHGSALYLRDLGRHYGDDPTKVLAAYNWGPGNLDKDIKKYGADWFKHLPKETDQYVRKILKNGDAFFTALRTGGGAANLNPTVKIEIRNFTGSDVVTQTGQAAR